MRCSGGAAAYGQAVVGVHAVSVRLASATVLDGVDLSVPTGDWVSVIGPNGAGKSTLLRAVAGLVPYTGSVRLGGVEVTAMRRRDRARTVAMVPQTPVVPPGITALEYVLLGRTPHIPVLGREGEHDLDVATGLLGQLDLDGFAGRSLATLSGGERQRVFLARALAQEATVLLLDEPTSALDIGHQQEVLELVDELRHSAGLTVLSTMHDLVIAGEYADRLVLLHDGTVAAAGSPDEVLTEENLSHHYAASVRVVPGEAGPVVIPVRPVPRARPGR